MSEGPGDNVLPLTQAEVERLQRAAGNQAVLRLLHGLRRAEAERNPPDDKRPGGEAEGNEAQS